MIKGAPLRQWQLLQMIHREGKGPTLKEIQEELGISRATLYRYLERLEQAGFPIVRDTTNQTARVCLPSRDLPPLNPTTLQMAALMLARRFLEPLEGTQLVAQYDALLSRWARTPATELPIETSPPPGKITKPSILAAIEQAIQKRQRVRFVYKKQGKLGERIVDPILLRIEQTTHLYFHAFDTEKNESKTYKPVRMMEAEVLAEPAQAHPELDQEDPFAYSVKIWSAAPIDVAIRVSSKKADFVVEWPLIDGQQLDEQPDGSVIVRARVAGPQEASKWVLSWGRDAVVLEPPELRKLVRDELAAALSGYSDD